MIHSSDLIHLPYTPDLTEGGIAYALRSLPHSFERFSYDAIRRTVAGVAVELAVRRYLSQQEIPFDVSGGTPFTEADKYHITLGGHRVDIKSFLISQRGQISQIRSDPAVLLKAPALVPSDLQTIDATSDNDLYLFAFCCGLIASAQTDLMKAVETGQPHYLIHVMPRSWRKPSGWHPLGPLVLKSESDAEMLVEVSGQDESRGFITRLISLPPQKRITVNEPFYSVSAVHIQTRPTGRLGIHGSVNMETHIISSLDWGNIWVYGLDIILAGFISYGAFRQRAKQVAPNTRVFQFNRTKIKSLAVPVSELITLSELFTRVRKWNAG